MRLTKTTGHAIRILIDCAGADDERVKVASIANRLGISQLNAFKIVHILAKAGFIDAMRGRNGGVMLATAPEEIRIGAIVRAIESTEMIVAGATGAKKRDKAPINTIFEDALDAFIGVLDSHTLADIAPAVKRAKTKPAKESKASKAAKPVKTAKPVKPSVVLAKSLSKHGAAKSKASIGKASMAKAVAKKAMAKGSSRRNGLRA
jgi:Rrf2 family nitric oxide-sensitive transcriptional repressor